MKYFITLIIFFSIPLTFLTAKDTKATVPINEEKIVILRDGSRIFGMVTKKGNRVILQSPLLGKISIPKDSVQAIIEKDEEEKFNRAGKGSGDSLQDGDIITTEIVRFVPGSLKKIVKNKPSVVAIRRIKVEGKYNINDRVFETKLINEIVKKKQFVVVERQALKVLLKEQELSLTGLTDDNKGKIGKLIGVDAFMDVSVNVPNDYSMSSEMKITDVETNHQIWHDSFTGVYGGDLKLSVGLTWRNAFNYTFTGKSSDDSDYKLAAKTGQIFGLTVRMNQRVSFTRLMAIGLNINIFEQDFLMNKGEDEVTVSGSSGSGSSSSDTYSSGGIMMNSLNLNVGVVVKLHPSEFFNSSWDVIQPYAGVGIAMNRLLYVKEMDHGEEEIFKDITSPVIIVGTEFKIFHSFSCFVEYNYLNSNSVSSDDQDGEVSWGQHHVRAGILYHIFK